MIIAVDYDETLIIKGKANEKLISMLKRNQAMGSHIILNTCRHGKKLKEALDFCAGKGLRFSAVNENLPSVVKRFGYNPRKIYADIYIDDKAVKP